MNIWKALSLSILGKKKSKKLCSAKNNKANWTIAGEWLMCLVSCLIRKQEETWWLCQLWPCQSEYSEESCFGNSTGWPWEHMPWFAHQWHLFPCWICLLWYQCLSYVSSFCCGINSLSENAATFWETKSSKSDYVKVSERWSQAHQLLSLQG